MENFEKNIQKHFQQRSIEPSENAWNRLEELLDKEEQKQKKRAVLNWWNTKYAIAAVLVIGLGLLGTMYQWENKENVVFDSNEITTNPSHQVVVEKTEERISKEAIANALLKKILFQKENLKKKISQLQMQSLQMKEKSK